MIQVGMKIHRRGGDSGRRRLDRLLDLRKMQGVDQKSVREGFRVPHKKYGNDDSYHNECINPT